MLSAEPEGYVYDRIYPELIKAGIDSFKIEGRMKKTEYVAGVTSVYRRRIDACLDSPDGAGKVSASDMHILSSLYIRSEISGGYYHRHNGREMITLDQPGYAGCDEAVLQNIRSGILEPELTVPVILEASLHPGRPLRLKAALARERYSCGSFRGRTGGTDCLQTAAKP